MPNRSPRTRPSAGERSQTAATSTPGSPRRHARCCRAICPARSRLPSPIPPFRRRGFPTASDQGAREFMRLDSRRDPEPGLECQSRRGGPGITPRKGAAPHIRGASRGRDSRGAGSRTPQTPRVRRQSGDRAPAPLRCLRRPGWLTMALRIAIPSTILRRVPPPNRSGTTTAAAEARWAAGPPRTRSRSTRGPRQVEHRSRRARSDDLASASGRTAAIAARSPA